MSQVTDREMLDHLITILIEKQGDEIPEQYHDALKAEFRREIINEIIAGRAGEQRGKTK